MRYEGNRSEDGSEWNNLVLLSGLQGGLLLGWEVDRISRRKTLVTNAARRPKVPTLADHAACDWWSAHDLKIHFRRRRTLANDANLLDQLQRPVQIRVPDCICRENREFCYFATILLREAFLGLRR